MGRTYDLVPLKVPGGCFHPKVMVLDGADGLRATVGSGNLTFGGWGHNVETLDLLVPAQAPLTFADFLGYLALHIDEGRIAAPGRPAMVGAMEGSCRRAIVGGWLPCVEPGTSNVEYDAQEERVAAWARTLVRSPSGRAAIHAVTEALFAHVLVGCIRASMRHTR